MILTLTLENEISEVIDIKLKDTYDRTDVETNKSFRYDFISNDNDEDTISTLDLKKV